ncbi:NHX3 [Symbiodinium microadriaticum]|nr:NHX3 [Symbiodinium microadriaticum]CAE7948782.1 NHX3 [Symbiodinium sp. KB8]
MQLDADLRQEMEMDRELWNKHIGTAFGLDLDKLPRRWLPPGHVMDLYNLFLARFQQKWATKLVFRSTTDFAECDRCFSLKEGIRQARDLDTKMGFVYDYKKHLEDVQRDRSLEQMLQSEDCFLTNNTPVLLVQTDGMDQAKWSVPRLWDRPSKEMGSVVRPRMKVQGVWIQSVCLQLYVADVHLAHDSSMTVEVTCPMNQDFMPLRTNCVADSRLDLEKSASFVNLGSCQITGEMQSDIAITWQMYAKGGAGVGASFAYLLICLSGPHRIVFLLPKFRG